jgi:Bacterial regulatory proteins, tetR family
LAFADHLMPAEQLTSILPLVMIQSIGGTIDNALIQSYDSNIRMTETVVDTKTKILDAAEKLFADKGFDATSLRDITTGADVNLAAANYHFERRLDRRGNCPPDRPDQQAASRNAGCGRPESYR